MVSSNTALWRSRGVFRTCRTKAWIRSRNVQGLLTLVALGQATVASQFRILYKGVENRCIEESSRNRKQSKMFASDEQDGIE